MNQLDQNVSRREFVASSLGVTAGLCVPCYTSWNTVFGAADERPYRIGICDWDLRGVSGRPEAFASAKELGFDGVEVSFLPEGKDSLRVAANRPRFRVAAAAAGIACSSLAMGVLNGRPLATVPEAEGWVLECLDAMQTLEVKTVLLAFFGKGDMKDNPDAKKKVAAILKRLAPEAERRGKTLGIESYLNAEEHLALLDAIGSDAVKVYYDPQNMLAKNYSVMEDFEKLLQAQVVCQLHAKEYGARLGRGKLDFPKIRSLLDRYNYRGWVVVEGGVEGDADTSQQENVAYLRDTFAVSPK